MNKATGPTTLEGKHRSSKNAFTHGLTGQTLLLTPEEKVLFDQHARGYFDLYKPAGHPETVLVQCIAEDYWRALRGRSLQDASLRRTFEETSDETIESSPTASLHNEKALANLSLYIQRIERSIKNNTQSLQEMQDQRKKAQHTAEQEVKLLARSHWAMGRPYDPAKDFPPERGFVFSTEQVIEMVTREDRLDELHLWQRMGFNPKVERQKPLYKVPEAA